MSKYKLFDALYHYAADSPYAGGDCLFFYNFKTSYLTRVSYVWPATEFFAPSVFQIVAYKIHVYRIRVFFLEKV